MVGIQMFVVEKKTKKGVLRKAAGRYLLYEKRRKKTIDCEVLLKLIV